MWGGTRSERTRRGGAGQESIYVNRKSGTDSASAYLSKFVPAQRVTPETRVAFLRSLRMLSLWGAERAFLLRRQLSKLHRPGQFAALVAGTGRKIAVTDAARMLAVTEMFPHELSSLLMGEALRPDVPTP